MCGIAGIFNINNSLNRCEIQFEKLYTGILHRGPDGFGVEEFENTCVLFHSRLSIIDLSNHGSQPITSLNGRFKVVYNGEIYNYKELGALCTASLDLSSVSDSRVLVEYISEFGLEDFLSKAQGMWAFCLYDTELNGITLVRDISGQKPLYYSYFQDNIIFSSTLTSLLEVRNIKLSDKHIVDFISKGTIELSDIGIFSLSPGHYLKIDAVDHNATSNLYYSLPKFRNREMKIQEMEALLSKHSNWLLRSDRPVGILLSGGVDSSLLATIISNSSSNKLYKAYSISFDADEYDESQKVVVTSNRLGLDLKLIELKSSCVPEFFKEVDFKKLDFISDTSFLPMFFLSKVAGSEVKVVLTGDGGDEIMGGYSRHVFLHDQSFLYKSFRFFVKYFKFAKIALLNYTLLFGKLQLRRKLEKAFEGKEKFLGYNHWSLDLAGRSDLMSRDFSYYLPTVLSKVDSATMYHGLEARTLYLNREVVDYCFELKINDLISGGVGKRPFREILKKREVEISAEKFGFTPPLFQWFNNDLKFWLEEQWLCLDVELTKILMNYDINYNLNYRLGIYDVDFIWRVLFMNYKLKSFKEGIEKII